MRSYIIESNNVVLEYSKTLAYAKKRSIYFHNRGFNYIKITCLNGDYFGEGFHKYELFLIRGIDKLKWKKRV